MKIVLRLVLICLFLSACAATSNNAAPEASLNKCSANLGIDSTISGKVALKKLLDNSALTADENGLVETYFKNSKNLGSRYMTQLALTQFHWGMNQLPMEPTKGFTILIG